MKVSKKFIDDFDLCMKHYECTDEEISFEKERVRANYAEASKCYASIADGIRKFNQVAAFMSI